MKNLTRRNCKVFLYFLKSKNLNYQEENKEDKYVLTGNKEKET